VVCAPISMSSWSSSTARPTTCTYWSSPRPPWRSPFSSATQRPHCLRGAPRIHRRVCPRPHARPPVVAVLLRRLLWRCTAGDHQAIHQWTSPTTLNAGRRPATTGWAHLGPKVQGLGPKNWSASRSAPSRGSGRSRTRPSRGCGWLRSRRRRRRQPGERFGEGHRIGLITWLIGAAAQTDA